MTFWCYALRVASVILAATAISAEMTEAGAASEADQDLNASGYYNRPNATRADFRADWQECRLVAREATIPADSDTSIHRADLDWDQGILGHAIADGQMRRYNRKACLLIKGWRYVEPDVAEKKKLRSMRSGELAAFLDQAIGSTEGNYTKVEYFANDVADPRIGADTDIRDALKFTRQIQKNVKFKNLRYYSRDEPDLENGLVVIGFRRHDELSTVSAGLVAFALYDPSLQTLLPQPAPITEGAKASYLVIGGSQPGIPLEYVVLKLAPGDYVLFSAAAPFPDGTPYRDFCMGAPTFAISAGDVLYFGDITPYWLVPNPHGLQGQAGAYSHNLASARNALTARPKLAAALKSAAIQNGARYPCTSLPISAYRVPTTPADGNAAASELIAR